MIKIMVTHHNDYLTSVIINMLRYVIITVDMIVIAGSNNEIGNNLW